MRNNIGSYFVGLACFSLFFPSQTNADSIKCYGHDKTILSRSHISNVGYNGVFYTFKDDLSGKIIIANTDCIVKLDT